MGLGFKFCFFIGVCVHWIIGNPWRMLRGKPPKTWKQIYGGESDKVKDDLDHAGYDMFHFFVGLFLVIAALFLSVRCS